MMRTPGFLIFLFSGLLLMQQARVSAQDFSAESFFRMATIEDVRLSPDGKHLAMLFPGEDSSVLRIVNIDSGEVAASFATRSRVGVAEFHWATEERIVVATHRFMGGLEQPMLTGEIFGLNIDNTRKFQMVGPGVGDYAAFFIENILPDQPGRIRVSRYEVNRGSVSRSRPSSFLLDIDNRPPGNQSSMMRNLMREVRSPLSWGQLHSDHDGEVRLASAIDDDMLLQLRFRRADEDWQDISDQFIRSAMEGGFEFVGFSKQNDDFYFIQRSDHGTLGLHRYVVDNSRIETVFAHPEFDVSRSDLVLSSARDEILGAKFSGHVFETHYFSEHPEVALQRGLDASFPGERVKVTSMSRDGKRSLVGVFGPQRVGEFYLLENDALQMIYLGGFNSDLPVDAMAPVTPFAIRSPDDFVLSGYLTKRESAETPLPLIVIPHGGPVGVRDHYGFNHEAQYLARHGFAVLQVNFRGSGGFGLDHLQRGFGQWGSGMVDDLHLAMRWAVQSGHADPDRVCIYGASYGAFAALTSVARYPDDYRCAAGYAGVYDLNELSRSDIPFLPGGERYLARAVGTDAEELHRQSPVNMADRIKVPVLLAHGGEDRRAPLFQAEAMQQALQEAGYDPAWIFHRAEGHGFFAQENRIAFYESLLAFFNESLGLSDPADMTR
ncbi:MAG: prolyl oligopeptidase family serine peptidase [Pseudohongiella sp.]|uniref:alpha/beta hydrolase family protein n=1 Tax=Pseudohongiella sp. TaxID=1979412 RepID=UPI00349FFAB7